MQENQKVKESVNSGLWYAGWHGKITILGLTVAGAILGYLADAAVVGGTLAFFAAPIVWVAGLLHVNRNYEDVLKWFKSVADKKATSILHFDQDEDVSTFSLLYGSGSKWLRKPNLKYGQATLLVTDYSVTVYDDATLDMVGLNLDLGSSTEEIFYDNIASVNYEDGKFWINRSDGKGHSWPSERKPDDALAEIQQRLRDYKRQTV